MYWGYYPLTEESKTLTFIPQISCFVITKVGSARIAENSTFFKFSLNRFLITPIWETNNHCKKGSMPTKCDYSRLIWFSTSEGINKMPFYTPLFGLSNGRKKWKTAKNSDPVYLRSIKFLVINWRICLNMLYKCFNTTVHHGLKSLVR